MVVLYMAPKRKERLAPGSAKHQAILLRPGGETGWRQAEPESFTG